MSSQSPDDGTGLVVWGAKGHALVLAEFADLVGFRVALLVDNDAGLQSPLDDVELVHGRDGLDRWLHANPGRVSAFAVAIGGGRGRDRIELHDLLVQRDLHPARLVHPTAYVARDAEIGAGGQVLAQATVGARANLGRDCIINTSASVDHECVLGDGVHVGPGATLAGNVTLGRSAFVGAGAVVLPRVHVGADAVIGAGAVVTADVADATVVVGNPARPTAAG
jgi:sugar O-acyltransferase (sialic acid O-acetyltransferase NeuD family)